MVTRTFDFDQITGRNLEQEPMGDDQGKKDTDTLDPSVLGTTDMSLSRVPGDDNLYIGGIFTLNRRSALEAANITHIVSVLRYDFKDFKDWQKFKQYSVQVDDVEDENLLGEFANTARFIKEGLDWGGGVLVHCAMGKSRSVTIVLAYLLLTRPHALPTVASALSLVRQSRPIAEPNSGFIKQLELYKSMGCPTDIDAQPAYQRWLYQHEVDLSVATGRAPDRLRFEDEEQQDVAKDDDPSSGKELRCRKCRRTLATPQYLIPHVPKTTQSSTATASETGPIASLPLPNPSAAVNVPSACKHHFLHPLSWMRGELEKSELSGRLECPNAKCGASVGRYAWQGLKCSCGEWVVPGFSLAAGKVDEVTVRKAAGAGSGIRMPPGSGRGSL